MKVTTKKSLFGTALAAGTLATFFSAAAAYAVPTASAYVRSDVDDVVVDTDPADSMSHFIDYEEEFQNRVYEAIMANPQIIFEAIDQARAEERAAQEAERKEMLTKIKPMLEQATAPVLGNPDGDVTVVEFYDYNCPYCKKVSADVKALIASDKNVRVVMREFPILGDTSTEAASVALASHGQGRFEDVHMALMEHKKRLTEGDALKIAEDLGLNMGLLEQDMLNEDIERHTDFSMEIARVLGITGTPAFIIGDEIVPGAVGVEQLQELVDVAREKAAE